MKMFTLIAWALAGGFAHAVDPIGDAFFAPELIMKAQEQLGLSVDQKSTFELALLEFQQSLQTLQGDLRRESAKLAALAKAEQVDEKAAGAQADRIFEIERQMKHAQLSLLVLLKNALTPAQRTKMSELKEKVAAIAAKSNQVKAGAERWKVEGRDLGRFSDLKSEIEALTREGKFGEVEAVLDRALETLNSPGAK